MKTNTWLKRCVAGTAAITVALTPQTLAIPQEAGSPNQSSNIRLAISLPQPIDESDLEQYRQMLDLSDAQVIFSHHAHESYVERFQGLARTKFEDLTKLSALAGDALGEGYTPAAGALQAEFSDLQSEIEQGIVAIDEELFARMSAVLSESQLNRMPRVQWHRERARSFPLDVFVRAARIDLARLIDQQKLAPQSMEAIEAMQIEYEAQLTPLIASLKREAKKNSVARMNALISYFYAPNGERLEEGTPEATARGEVYLRNLKTLSEQEGRTERRLAELNNQFVPRFLGVMMASEAREFEKQFLEAGYPVLYPDPTDPRDLLDELVDFPTLDPAVKEALQAMRQRHRESYKSVCKEMANEYDNWYETIARTRAQGDYESYREKMRTLRAKRWKLNEDCIQQLADTLGNWDADYSNRLREMQQDVAAIRERGETDGFPGM
ncbi:MAG: hypothetical protein L0Y44_15615 [Phycisphaerales bacterium]|nr:hypothetical protein [Phycisphaerales bacterium]MCI0676363.1 hypothetical protein [Phycisphaerales bacterium]